MGGEEDEHEGDVADDDGGLGGEEGDEEHEDEEEPAEDDADGWEVRRLRLSRTCLKPPTRAIELPNRLTSSVVQLSN